MSRENLAAAGDMPMHFLGKILQSLARARLINSHRGVTGGFSMRCDPEQTTMLEVLEAIEGPLFLNTCVSPEQGCSRQSWCAAHQLWAEAQRQMTAVLGSGTIAQLARDSMRPCENERCALAEGALR